MKRQDLQEERSHSSLSHSPDRGTHKTDKKGSKPTPTFHSLRVTFIKHPSLKLTSQQTPIGEKAWVSNFYHHLKKSQLYLVDPEESSLGQNFYQAWDRTIINPEESSKSMMSSYFDSHYLHPIELMTDVGELTKLI